MTTEERAPRRLAESSGAAGDVLRRALSEQELGAPLPRFTHLQDRRLGRVRRQSAALLLMTGVALLLGVRALRSTDPPLTVRAEPLLSAPLAAASSESLAATSEEAPLPPARPVTPREETTKPRVALPRASAARGLPEAPAKGSTPAPVELPGSAKACAELARTSVVEEAIGCYEALARGSGVSAELALFEQARLAGKALRQPARALALLQSYRDRFPSGSLRAEAMLARIEWSLAAGDTNGARATVDEALASGLLVERRAELERLRASLAADAAPAAAPH